MSTKAEEKILEALRLRGGEMTKAEIALATGYSEKTVALWLPLLVAQGKIQERRRYRSKWKYRRKST